MDLKELKNIYRDFIAISNQMLSNSKHDDSKFMLTFINFIDNQEVIASFINKQVEKEYDIQSFKTELYSGFNLPIEYNRQISFLYQYLKKVVEPQGEKWSCPFYFNSCEKKYVFWMKEFNDTLNILVKGISYYLQSCIEEKANEGIAAQNNIEQNFYGNVNGAITNALNSSNSTFNINNNVTKKRNKRHFKTVEGI